MTPAKLFNAGSSGCARRAASDARLCARHVAPLQRGLDFGDRHTGILRRRGSRARPSAAHRNRQDPRGASNGGHGVTACVGWRSFWNVASAASASAVSPRRR